MLLSWKGALHKRSEILMQRSRSTKNGSLGFRAGHQPAETPNGVLSFAATAPFISSKFLILTNDFGTIRFRNGVKI